MPSKRSKKKKLPRNETPQTKPRRIFSPLDRDGPYKNSPRSFPFLRLPGEVRNEIYLALFSSTRISFGETIREGGKTLRVLPAKYSLSLLHTCRNIYIEANPLWPGQVLFHFGSIDAMVDKITPLPLAMRKEIRQLRVRWTYERRSIYMYFYTYSWALQVLYKLCLDRLTVVFDEKHEVLSHNTEFYLRIMFELTTYGHGWKELHCMINSGVILSELSKSPNSNSYISQAQYFHGANVTNLHAMGIFTLEDYLKMEFLKRDGPSSDASIMICRSIACAHFGFPSIMDPAFYMEVDKKKPLPPTQLKRSCKCTLLVAKRASNVNVMSPTWSRQPEFPILTWSRLKEKLSQARKPAIKYEGEMYDSYKSPLEYSWQSSKNTYTKRKQPCV